MNSKNADITFESGVYTTALYILLKCIIGVFFLVSERNQWSVIAAVSLYFLSSFFQLKEVFL